MYEYDKIKDFLNSFDVERIWNYFIRLVEFDENQIFYTLFNCDYFSNDGSKNNKEINTNNKKYLIEKFSSYNKNIKYNNLNINFFNIFEQSDEFKHKILCKLVNKNFLFSYDFSDMLTEEIINEKDFIKRMELLLSLSKTCPENIKSIFKRDKSLINDTMLDNPPEYEILKILNTSMTIDDKINIISSYCCDGQTVPISIEFIMLLFNNNIKEFNEFLDIFQYDNVYNMFICLTLQNHDNIEELENEYNIIKFVDTISKKVSEKLNYNYRYIKSDIRSIPPMNFIIKNDIIKSSIEQLESKLQYNIMELHDKFKSPYVIDNIRFIPVVRFEKIESDGLFFESVNMKDETGTFYYFEHNSYVYLKTDKILVVKDKEDAVDYFNIKDIYTSEYEDGDLIIREHALNKDFNTIIYLNDDNELNDESEIYDIRPREKSYSSLCVQ